MTPDHTTMLAIGEHRRLLVRVRSDLGVVALTDATESEAGSLDVRGRCEIPLERIGDLCAILARASDAQQTGELPKSRAAALAAQGIPEGATPVVGPGGLLGHALGSAL